MSGLDAATRALAALHAAVLAEDYAGAQVLMKDYDRTLRQTVAGGEASHAELEDLFEAQRRVLREFVALRDRAGAELRQLDHAGRATRAYLQAG